MDGFELTIYKYRQDGKNFKLIFQAELVQV